MAEHVHSQCEPESGASSRLFRYDSTTRIARQKKILYILMLRMYILFVEGVDVSLSGVLVPHA